MADPEPDTGLIERTQVSSLSIGSDQIRALHGTISEEILQQSLSEGNDFDSSSIAYAVPTTDGGAVTDSTNRPTPVSNGIGRISFVQTLSENVSYPLDTISSLENDTGQIIAHNSQSDFVADMEDAKKKFTHTSASDVLNSDPQPVLKLNSSDGTYVTTITEEQNISIADSLTNTLPEQRNGTVDDSLSVKAETESESVEHPPVVEGVGLVEGSTKTHIIRNETFPQGIKVSTPHGISINQEVLQSVLQQVKAQQLTQQSSDKQMENTSNENSQNNSVSVTLVSPSQQNTHAPLGSSQNPIRIIQQGNRYTPMQQLTPDQLQQIMQVVRQQHVNKSAQDNGGTVIFNPVTNTKIMYRVIYPSELHKSQIPDTQYRVVRPSTLSQEQQTITPHQKRVYRKRKDASGNSAGTVAGGEDDKGGGDASELSKEEKEERKKHRPRTRSGRVSKPPKHMVQDYKQLHVLDWDEDYDDSDGGYSDFKHSDEEGKGRKTGEEETEESPGLLQGLGSGKPKNYKCQTCDKSYIGQAGLARHYRLNPDHLKSESESLLNSVSNRSLDGEDSSKDASINQDGNSSRASDAGQDIAKTNGIENFSEDSNTQDSLNSNGACSPIVRRGRGRGVYRGRWAHLKHNAQMRKKNKLREFAKRCSDEDLMEVLFPRLVNSISTWEFLMMKSEKGGSRPQVDIIYKEFEGLLRHVKQVCQDYLKPINTEDDQRGNCDMKTIKVQDQNQAAILGLEVGMYRVDEMLPDDTNSFSSLHNKLSAATLSTMSAEEMHENSTPSGRSELLNVHGEAPVLKRKFTTLSPTEMHSLPLKKQKILNSTSTPVNLVTTSSTVNSEMDIKKQNGSGLKISAGPEAVSALPPFLIKTASLTTTMSSSVISSKPATSTLLSQISKLDSPLVTSVSLSSATHSQPSISYLIAAPHNKTATSTSRAQASQLVPVVLNSNMASASTSTSQVLPVIFSTKNTTGISPQQQTLMVAAPGMVGNKPVHSSAMPIVLAAPGGQIPGNTMVLAPTNPASGQHVLIRQSPKQMNLSQQRQQQKTKVILAPHPTNSTTKSQLSLLDPTLSASAQGGHKSVPYSSQISRFSSNPKPAEVKVSRRLFHEATASSSLLSSSLQHTSALTSSSLSNGNQNVSNIPTSQQTVKQDFVKSVSLANLNTQKVTPMPLSSNSSISANIADINDPQFIGGAVTTGGDEDMDTSFDISAGVLGSIGFSGDELAPLNTSSSSSVLLSSTNLAANAVATMVKPWAAPSSISSGIPLTLSKAADGTVLSNDTHVTSSDLSLINGTRSEFSEISPPSVTLKDSIINNSSLVSSSNFMSSVSDFINPSAKPSSPLMSSPSKDNVGLSTVSSVSFNLPTIDSLTSHILKSEESPAIMNDLEGLNFSDQSNLPTAEQLGGVSTVLQGHGVVNILPDQMTPSYESTDTLLPTSNTIPCDDLENVENTGEEDGQLLLTEGSSIYQTADGMLIIESADGNQYQLASTQGFPLETVQALVSGNLGEVSGDGITDGNLQADLHLQ